MEKIEFLNIHADINWFEFGKFIIEEAYTTDEISELLMGIIYHIDKIDDKRIEDIVEIIIEKINSATTHKSELISKNIIKELNSKLNKGV